MRAGRSMLPPSIKCASDWKVLAVSAIRFGVCSRRFPYCSNPTSSISDEVGSVLIYKIECTSSRHFLKRQKEQDEGNDMTLPENQDYVMNWSMTERSPCYVFKAQDIVGIMHALTTARTWGLSVIPHGTGHSYTDAE